MIWLTWRQSRTHIAVFAAALVVLAGVLAITMAPLSHLADGASATDFLFGLTNIDTALYVVGSLVVLAVPGLIGVFWGAPLITRELDAGTHRLVWNQGITRTRWLATKLGCTAIVAMAVAALASLVVTWWAGPIDTAADANVVPVRFYLPKLVPVIFDARGVVPAGFAAFAFMLGVLVGVLVRHTLPAMAVTLVGYVTVQVAMAWWLVPNLIAPLSRTVSITSANLQNVSGTSMNVISPVPGAWIIDQHTIDAAGNTANAPGWFQGCLGTTNIGQVPACLRRLGAAGFRQVVDYQPAGRF